MVGLAQEDASHVVVGRWAIGPDLVERDEEVRRRRASTVGEEVAELIALAGDVVDHEVDDHVVVRGQRADVGPATEARVDLAVGQRREATVTRGREGRQHVEPGEEAGERPGEQRAERRPGRPPSESGYVSSCGPWRTVSRACRPPWSGIEAAAHGLDEPRGPLVGDAAHLVVDVGEADAVRVIGEGQLAARTPVPEAAWPEERRAGRRGE